MIRILMWMMVDTVGVRGSTGVVASTVGLSSGPPEGEPRFAPPSFTWHAESASYGSHAT